MPAKTKYEWRMEGETRSFCLKYDLNKRSNALINPVGPEIAIRLICENEELIRTLAALKGRELVACALKKDSD